GLRRTSAASAMIPDGSPVPGERAVGGAHRAAPPSNPGSSGARDRCGTARGPRLARVEVGTTRLRMPRHRVARGDGCERSTRSLVRIMRTRAERFRGLVRLGGGAIGLAAFLGRGLGRLPVLRVLVGLERGLWAEQAQEGYGLGVEPLHLGVILLPLLLHG